MLKLIDTHFHVWDLAVQDLPWLAGTDGSITRTFTPADFHAAYDAVPDVELAGAVYVEVDGADPLQEDALVYDICQANPWVVGAMMRSTVEPAMRVPVFATGVREPLHIDSEPAGRCLEPSFIEGMRVMAAKGMPFESCNRVSELADIATACEQVPEATVVINHMGNVEAIDDAYVSAMKRLAALPNVYLKVSGYSTEDEAFARQLAEFARDTFRADRVLYASNWPVVDLYGATLEKHISILRDVFGDDDRLFRTNAIACYGLEPSLGE